MEKPDFNLPPERDDTGKTALHHAVEANLLDQVLHLLELYNDTNERYMLIHGSFRRPEYQSSYIVNFVNERDNEKKTALDYALEMTSVEKEICIALLMSGARIDDLDELAIAKIVTDFSRISGNRPLILKYSTFLEKLLLKAPKSWHELYKQSPDYLFPRFLNHLYWNCRVHVLSIILDTVDETKRKSILCTGDVLLPLDKISQEMVLDEEYMKMAKYLIDNGSDRTVNGVDCIYLILMTATINGYVNTFKHFINFSSDVDKIKTYFFRAVFEGHFDIVKYLLSFHLEHLKFEGGNPMHIALSRDCDPGLNIIRLINGYGKFIEDRDQSGCTPLQMALLNNSRLDLIKYLVEQCGTQVTENYLSSAKSKEIKDYLASKVRTNLLRYLFSIFSTPLYSKSPREIESYFGIKSNHTGWDVNAKNARGQTILHMASEAMIWYIVESLLLHSARYDEKDISGKTPLELNPKRSHLEDDRSAWLLSTLDMLFRSSDAASLEERIEKSLKSGEWGAYGSGHPDCFDRRNPTKYFLNARNNQGRTLLHVAARLSDVSTIEFLLNGFKDYFPNRTGEAVNSPDDDGNCPIHFAAECGSFSIVRILLENGSNYAYRNNRGKTPLMLATENSHDEVIEMLTLVGNIFCSVERNDSEGLQSLRDFSEIKEFVNCVDENGRTLLHLAAISNGCQSVTFLLEKGADNNIRDLKGNTALHLAASRNSAEAMRLLLRSGSVYNAKNSDGSTPSKLTSDKTIFSLIDTSFHVAKNLCEKTLSDVLSSHAEYVTDIVNVRDSNDKTLLHLACLEGRIKDAEFLLENGAIYKRKTLMECFENKPTRHRGETAELLYRVRQIFNESKSYPKNSNMITQLSALRPDRLKTFINIQDEDGHNALRKSVLKEDYMSWKWLLSHGADVNMRNRNGSSAMDLVLELQPQWVGRM